MNQGTLIFFCGKMGAGKTTLSRRLAEQYRAVLLSEDAWLADLYPEEILSLEDYVNYSQRLKKPVKALVQAILNSGNNVVMDFPANTPKQRQWFKDIYTEVNAAHELWFIDVDNSVCLERIAKRRVQQPERQATDTEEMFEKVTQYFVAPDIAEGFEIKMVNK